MYTCTCKWTEPFSSSSMYMYVLRILRYCTSVKIYGVTYMYMYATYPLRYVSGNLFMTNTVHVHCTWTEPFSSSPMYMYMYLVFLTSSLSLLFLSPFPPPLPPSLPPSLPPPLPPPGNGGAPQLQLSQCVCPTEDCVQCPP